MHFGMLLSNNKHIKWMKKYISVGVLTAILFFALSFIIITTFSNPIECERSKQNITIGYSVFAFIMTGYWVYCIVETFKSKKWFYGIIILVGLFVFFYIPSSLYQGLFLEIGTCIFLLNMLIWCVYYVKYRDMCFLILIVGWLFFLLTLPYCTILYD